MDRKIWGENCKILKTADLDFSEIPTEGSQRTAKENI